MKVTYVPKKGKKIVYNVTKADTKLKHPGGRPTSYSPLMLQLAQQYIDECQDTILEYHKTRGEKSDSYDRLVNVQIPTRGGMARYLHVNRDTLYEWAKVHPEFSDIMDALSAEQENRLINNGLSGTYNSVIAKVLLTKHGYTDKTDITSDGKALPTPILSNVQLHDGHTEDSKTEEKD